MKTTDHGLIMFEFLLIGNAKSGKTPLFNGGGSSILYFATIKTECVAKSFTVVEGNTRNRVTGIICDSPGISHLENVAISAIENKKGIMIIYDVTNRDDFHNIDKWFERVKSYHSGPIPVILVGNKIDLEKEREVSTIEGQKKAYKYGVPYFEVSAINRLLVKTYSI